MVKNKLPKKPIMPFDDPEFLEYWGIWKLYKRKNHKFKYKNVLSEQGALKKLSEMSNGNSKTAIKILETSIANEWKGFFPLKNNINEQSKQKHSTGSIESIFGKLTNMYKQNGTA